MMLFGGLGIISILIYLALVVLAGMFLYWGIVYFRRKIDMDQALSQKLDRLIEVLDKENHNGHGNE